jgi:hypothetical protein
VVVLKEPGNSLAVGFFPQFPAFFLIHLVSLIQIGMTTKTQSRYPKIVSLEGSTLAVTELVGVSRADCAVLRTTILAWRITNYL